MGTCALWGFFLQHLVVMSAHGGNLWQVGDGDDLAVEFAHLCHDLCHLLGYLSAYTCVDLVEDDGWQLDGSADHCLE